VKGAPARWPKTKETRRPDGPTWTGREFFLEGRQHRIAAGKVENALGEARSPFQAPLEMNSCTKSWLRGLGAIGLSPAYPKTVFW